MFTARKNKMNFLDSIKVYTDKANDGNSPEIIPNDDSIIRIIEIKAKLLLISI